MSIKNIPDPSKAVIKCPDCKNKMDFLYELNLSLFQCPNCKTIALCHIDGEGEFYIVSANRKDRVGDLSQEPKHENSVLNKIFMIANNAIYFRDNSDYLTALYEICEVIKPGDETVGEKFIEEVKE